MIREALAGLARNESIGGAIARTPIARDAVARLVAGEDVADAVTTAALLADDGYWTALERTTSPHPDVAEATEAFDGYAALVDAVAVAGLAASCEVAVLPESIGLALDPRSAGPRLRDLAMRAADADVELRLGFGPQTDVEASLGAARELWNAGLDVSITLPAARRATEADCDTLGDRRVRLVKGTATEESAGAYRQAAEIDKAFVRCARRLLRADGAPSFATHDPRLVEIVEAVAARTGRAVGSYEFTFFMGRQEGLARRLVESGHRVRVYAPYGPHWFERLVAGLAEQPSGLAAAVRSLFP